MKYYVNDNISIRSIHIFLNKYEEVGSEILYYVCVNISFKRYICQMLYLLLDNKSAAPALVVLIQWTEFNNIVQGEKFYKVTLCHTTLEYFLLILIVRGIM